jgi:hypothetical protein
MNDPTTPAEDELITAVLDGEATDDERAMVQGDERLLARLRSFEQLRTALGDVPPPTPEARDSIIERAVVATDEPAPTGDDDRTVVALARYRRQRKIFTAVGVAAALLIVIPLLALTLFRSGTETTDTAAELSSNDAAEEAAGRGLAPSVDAPDLGLITSPDQLRVIVGAALSSLSAARTERNLESASPAPSTATTLPATADAWGTQSATTTCAASLAAADPSLGEPVLLATARWKGEPAFVLVFRAAPTSVDPSAEVIVVARPDCTTVERLAA